MEIALFAWHSPLRHAFTLYYLPLIWLYDLINIIRNIDYMAIQMLHCPLKAQERLLKSEGYVNV